MDSLGRYAVGTIHPLFYDCLFVHQAVLLGFFHPLDLETPTVRHWPREWCRMCRLTRCLTLKSGSRVARDVGRPPFPSVIQPTPNPPDRREETVFQGCSSQSITPATSTLRPYVLIFTQTAVSDSFSWNIMTFNHVARLSQDTGNKVSRKAIIAGPQNIILGGKTIISNGAIIRGDLRRTGSGHTVVISLGRYCLIGEGCIMRYVPPPFSQAGSARSL